MRVLNLTELEQQALVSHLNMADGHPRQDPTDEQWKIIHALPELFEVALALPADHIEEHAQRAFFAMLGQHRAPIADGRVFSVYSSSVATMVVGNVLAQRQHRLALLHPTFDNISDLLRRSVTVLPVGEDDCAPPALDEIVQQGATSLFVTTPNNPTGWYLDSAALKTLAEACKVNGILLCLDTSFRGFDVRAQYDTYEILDRSGVSYIVIEDTGKIWPMAELKLGFLAVSDDLREAVAHALSEVLLSVSPLVLKLVETLSLDAAASGMGALHELIATNRSRVTAAVADLPGVAVADPDARVSVCRLRFDSAEAASRVLGLLRGSGIHLLPCQQFHWARPGEGGRYLRLALARNTVDVDTALAHLAEATRTR
ncbi:aminotransferase class I/II-fold pyridoxal phosphate-dependent enzyme [Phytohabitans houttuyneae]|uniref:Aminotransferase class I/classII large domain-containing protein n=1 Tax=Phytohabitans houttuyneae TaxID=1076126 RepID=A0A6V8K7Q7_9ACTN|nr:aminotransferase class I/II-fold pyridoxal phosphate-dependent enzyme [Phytohabitans houttuyneae]GFJ78026.1 hypothetical protein Phou_022060 [Phytohabitans houttuyneae]